MNKSTAIIIGNGASQNLYQSHLHTQDFVVVCNLNWFTPHDAVSIIDPQPIDYMYCNKISTQKPIWGNQKVNRLIDKYRLSLNFHLVHTRTMSMNNAQFVTVKLCSEGYDTVHYYGCDTFWSEDMTSSQDKIIPRPYRDITLYTRWRRIWQELFKEFNKTKFYIHAPVDCTPFHYGDNAYYHQHLVI